MELPIALNTSVPKPYSFFFFWQQQTFHINFSDEADHSDGVVTEHVVFFKASLLSCKLLCKDCV